MEKIRPGWSRLPPPQLSQATVPERLPIPRLMVSVSRLSLTAQVTEPKPRTKQMLLVIRMPVWLCPPHVKRLQPRSLSKDLRPQQEVRLDLHHGTYNVVFCGFHFHDDDIVIAFYSHVVFSRDYGDIFAGDYSEAPRPVSPRKGNQNPVAKAQSAKPPPRVRILRALHSFPSSSNECYDTCHWGEKLNRQVLDSETLTREWKR